MSIRILIVDDQALLRAGFRLILENEPDLEVVGEAADGADGLDLVGRLSPDIVLMDIRMPVLDGLEATRRLMAAETAELLGHEVRVIILTTFDLDEYVYDALRAGASGFLLKDAPPDQLIGAIHVVADGDALIAPSITRRLIAEFAARPVSSFGPPPGLADLTSRELEVLRLVARGRSNAEIADDLVVSGTTVKSHMARILMKLDLRDRVQAVVLAYECGLVRPGIDDGATAQGDIRRA